MSQAEAQPFLFRLRNRLVDQPVRQRLAALRRPPLQLAGWLLQMLLLSLGRLA